MKCSKCGQPALPDSEFCLWHEQCEVVVIHEAIADIEPASVVIDYCSHTGCLNNTKGESNYCAIHQTDEKKPLLRAKTLTDLVTQNYQQEYYEEILNTTSLSEDVAHIVSLYLSPDPLTKLKSIGMSYLRPKSALDHGMGNWYYVAIYSPLFLVWAFFAVIYSICIKVGAVSIMANDCPKLGILLTIYGAVWIPMVLVFIFIFLRQEDCEIFFLYCFFFIFTLVWTISSSIIVYPMNSDSCSNASVYRWVFWHTNLCWFMLAKIFCLCCKKNRK